jgi:hypothetical protein
VLSDIFCKTDYLNRKVDNFEYSLKSRILIWRHFKPLDRNFLSNFSTPVFKMWIIKETNKVALWNKRHFEEKKLILCSVFKIFSTDICWINI